MKRCFLIAATLLASSHVFSVAIAQSSPTAKPQRTAATTEDIQKVLQAVIDAPALQPFYHTKPLYVVGAKVPKTITLSKLGQKAVILTEQEAKQKRIGGYLKIDGLEIQKQDASVSLRYPSEGVVGKFKLKKKAQNWKVTSSDVGEL